jgi:primosomal replication protein N
MLYVDGKDDKGQTRQWTFEMGAPGALSRAGWNQTVIKKGDQITVEGWLARNKDDRANVKSVKLANGRELSGASSIADFTPAKPAAKTKANSN